MSRAEPRRSARSGRLAAALLAFNLAACGTMAGGHAWGSRATLLPGWQRLGHAATQAATDPHTWLPAAGAAVFGLTGWDKRISSWASRETPVFGSQRKALEASNRLRDATRAGMFLTALATPSGDGAGEVLWNKAWGIGLEIASVGATQTAVATVKVAAGRERPDRSDQYSFPSAHASEAFAGAALGRRNLEALELGPGLEAAGDVGLDALAIGTAWARVEAKKHYPSDVLAGAALANLIANFGYRAFVDSAGGPGLVAVTPAPLDVPGVSLLFAF